ncbi:unnamed protein product [Mytilus edulis]|uniref:Uncharacterized protein n=1 Tax=Mytilus edulis TaxID=6550 RepID=A0A8S3UHV1_MYTED|nr:unnamed protein product [Mytilus edulis]
MCQIIVGTEEHVKTIRMMNAVRDDLQSDNEFALITSGSFGEGLEMRGSDLDMMMVVKDIEVCEDANVGYKNNTIYFIMDTDNTLPGFVKLRLVQSNVASIFEMCEEIGSDYYIPNYSLRDRFVNKDFPIVHGPSNVFLRAKSYNMLGILFQLVGDTESARHAFELSYTLYPDPKENDALRRLSLIGGT